MIGFSFVSDWLRDWREFSRPITECSKAKPMQSWITYDTQKIALSLLFLEKRGRRPRVAGFIILSLKGLRRMKSRVEFTVMYIYLFIYLSVRLVCAGNDHYHYH